MTHTTSSLPTYVDPYPTLKGSDRVTVECGRCSGSGVYYGPSNASWNNGHGEATWCFACGGAKTTTILVSSARATERARVRAQIAAREAEERAIAARAVWEAKGFEDLLATIRTVSDGLRSGDPLRYELRDAGDALAFYAATDADADAARTVLAKITARDAAKRDVVEGRRVIEGVVLTVKAQDSAYGTTWKMLIDEGASKLWGSVPASIAPARGDRVTLTGTVERSKDDASFGFYTRPTKASILPAE